MDKPRSVKTFPSSPNSPGSPRLEDEPRPQNAGQAYVDDSAASISGETGTFDRPDTASDSPEAQRSYTRMAIIALVIVLIVGVLLALWAWQAY